MIRIEYIILTIFIIFTSCTERLEVSNEDVYPMLVECELSPSHRIEAKVKSTADFTDVTTAINIDDAILRLTTGVDIELNFQYDPKTETYFIPENFHRINPSYKYKLYAYRKGDDESLAMTASTIIPQSNKLSLVNKPLLSDVADDKHGTLKKVQFTLNADNAIEKNTYYRIKFYRKLYDQKIINGKSFTFMKGTEEMKFLGAEEDPLAFKVGVDKMLYVDGSALAKEATVTIQTTSPAKNLNALEKIFYSLEGITEASYRYQTSKTSQVTSATYGNSDPVINYKNTTKGFGYLGASSGISVDSFSVK
jgi:hypothetical protein